MIKISIGKVMLVTVLSVITVEGMCQKQDTVYVNYESVDDVVDKARHTDVKLFRYRDEQSGYEVDIPAWLALKETGKPNLFGGTFPAVKGIENALIVAALPKNKFKSFDEFENIYLTGNRFGKPALFDKDRIWYGQNELKKIPHGVEQRIFFIWNNVVYHAKFVLPETPGAYLWIQFSSTPQTYDENLPKFEEFVTGLKIIE